MRRIRSLLAVLALAIGVGAFAGPASPAQAGCKFPDCLELYYVIELVEPDPPCLCPYLAIEYLRDPRVNVVVAIDFTTGRTLPVDLQQEYLGQVARGLDLLGQAAAARDAAVADRLHDQAHGAFLGAARVLSRNSVELSAVGGVDVERRTFEPMPLPWLEAGGQDLAGGLNLLVRGLADPSPLPWFEKGWAQLDQAYQQLSEPGELR